MSRVPGSPIFNVSSPRSLQSQDMSRPPSGLSRPQSGLSWSHCGFSRPSSALSNSQPLSLGAYRWDDLHYITSFKELPSYLAEVEVALHRREEIRKLKARLNSSRQLLNVRTEYKPWLFFISSDQIRRTSKNLKTAEANIPEKGPVNTSSRSASVESDCDWSDYYSNSGSCVSSGL